ncbi:MAG: response regulator [Gorillibacterium sp.]|nr:response regulator [Gorillibacterium sp.]
MYKVIIVEDEKTIRDALCTFIDWESLGFRVTASFDNGEDALHYIVNEQPDCVLTDIRMPGMDGLEMIESVRALGMNIHFVILSGFDDFAYAKTAIRHKVFEYQVKPIDLHALAETFGRLNEELSRNVSERKVLQEADHLKREQTLNNWVKGLISPSQAAQILGLADVHSEKMGFALARIQISISHEDQGKWSKGLLKMAIGNILSEVMATSKGGETFVFDDDIDTLAVLMMNLADIEGLRKKMKEFATHVNSYLKQQINIGISTVLYDVNNAPQGYEEAGLQLLVRQLTGNDPAIPYLSMPNHRYFHEYGFQESEKSEMVECLVEEHYDHFIQQLSRKIDAIQAKATYQNEIVKVLFIQILQLIAEMESTSAFSAWLNEMVKDKSLLEWEEFHSYTDFKNSFCHLLELGFGLLQEKTGSQRRIIKKVKDYVKEHYGEDITLSSISEYVYLNPSYFSRVFKEETGDTFMQFLTRMRMQCAKEFLKESQYKVYEVSEMVGYNDYKSFSKAFKKMEGITPNEYRSGKDVKKNDKM